MDHGNSVFLGVILIINIFEIFCQYIGNFGGLLCPRADECLQISRNKTVQVLPSKSKNEVLKIRFCLTKR